MRGVKVGDEAREIIYRVYLFCSIEAERFRSEDGYFQKIRERTGDATGVSKKFLYCLLKEKGKYGSEASKKHLESLKRKFNDDEHNPDHSVDQQEFESVFFKNEPVITKVHRIDQKSKNFEENVTASDRNEADIAGPSLITKEKNMLNAHPTHQKITIFKHQTVQHATELKAKHSRPPVIIHRVQRNMAAKPTLSGPQIERPGTSYIKVPALSQSAATESATTSSMATTTPFNPSENVPGLKIIKVFQLRADNLRPDVAKTQLETPNKIELQTEIEIKSEEYDPGPIKTEIDDEIFD